MTAGAKGSGEGRHVRRHARHPVPAPLTHGDIRRANAWSVLQAVRAGGTVSRVEIGEQTGLTAMSVHRLMAELRHRRLVLPAGSSPAGSVGRPSSLFTFNGAIGHVVGFDVGNETTRAALVDLDRSELAEFEVGTADIEGDLPRHLLSTIGRLQEEACVRPDALMGLAVGIAGVTRPDGTIVRASQHHGWDGLALGVDVELRQDDHLAALAELRGGACVGMRTALLVNVGKGIGLGVIARGQVHAGAHGAAGRVTWIPLGPDAPDASAPLLVGDLLTADGIISDYVRAGGRPGLDGARGVFGADAAGDPAAREAIDLFSNRLGWLIATAITILDPEVVVVGGGISRAFERMREPLVRRVGQIIAAPPPIVPSTLGPGAVIAGALDAALALADISLQERLGP
jgi:predicted NBD/HSP70 family sugar kinase